MHTFTLSVNEWCKRTSAIGIYAKRGKFGGTYAHKDIAFEFASAISPVFKLYLIREFERLKELENCNREWDVKRILTKNNYTLQTNAIKKYIIPNSEYYKNKEWLQYAEEADILNVALFKTTAKKWRELNPNLSKTSNIRDYATLNDSAVALAEYIGGTEEKFVDMMNKKSKELGLKNTNFENVHGLTSENHYSCPYDMAIIAKELLKHDKILEYSSIYEEYLKKNDGSSIWMVNTNKLIKHYNGLDGLKTGYTDTAGYCLTATAKRNDMRLISVVMGEETSEIRSNKTIELLDYGFNNYKLNTIYKNTIDLGKIKIENGKKDYAKIKLKENVVDLENIEEDSKYDYSLDLKEIKAPIKKESIVGYLKLYKNGEYINKFDIIINEDIKKANLWNIFTKNLQKSLTFTPYIVNMNLCRENLLIIGRKIH